MNARTKAALRVGGLFVVLAVLLTVAASGCLDRKLAPLNPCVQSGVVERVKATNIEKVDVLFMVDNSNSMKEEQQSLAVQFPRLVSVLASGDKDNDGILDFPPVKDLNVGVVSSDMGTGPFDVGGVCSAGLGDDGILRTTPGPDVTGCQPSYPSFLNFQPERGDDVGAFAMDFQCVAQMGTGGCGFEQQLESALKALTPSTSSITFANGTSGQGSPNGANADFLRPDSLLAIILVTDEDDCSASDLELFNPDPDNPTYPGNINLRCFDYSIDRGFTAVHPVSRYVDGFLALREDPDLLIYAAITGVPPRLVSDPENINYTAILADPEMQEEVDPDQPTRLRTSCNVPGVGLAFPPRRIVQVAQALDSPDVGSNGIIQSICQEDFAPALDAIINKIADVLSGGCLPRALNPDSSGMVTCDVIEVLPTEGDFTSCTQLADLGRCPYNCSPGDCQAGTCGAVGPFLDIETGGEICRVRQISRAELDFTGGTCQAPAGVSGWFYDDCSEAINNCTGGQAQRITYTPGDEPKTGVLVRLECLQAVQASEDNPETRDAPCDPMVSPVCSSAAAQALCCEEMTRTWQVRCGSNSDCNEQGLGGFVCDLAGETDFGVPVCVNPTCDN